jgi:hypothetical protein
MWRPDLGRYFTAQDLETGAMRIFVSDTPVMVNRPDTPLP